MTLMKQLMKSVASTLVGLFPIFGIIFFASCTPISRNNPLDPGSGSNYKPHFRYVASVGKYSSAESFWAGKDALFLKVLAPSGPSNIMVRVGYDGITQKETGLSLPVFSSGGILRGGDYGGTTLVVSTNTGLIFLDGDFNFLSNSTALSALGALSGFLYFQGSPTSLFAYSANFSSTRLVRPGVFDVSNLAPTFPYDVSFGMTTVDDTVPPQMGRVLMMCRQPGGPGVPEYYGLFYLSPATGAVVASNIVANHSNIGGNEIQSFREPQGYGTQVLLRVVTSKGRNFIRVPENGAAEVLILEPEPILSTLNLFQGATTYGISSSGYLVVRQGTSFLIYKATGN